MTAALDRAVANALGLRSVNNCEKWGGEEPLKAAMVDLQPVQPQREWVGLTNADIERIKLMTYEKETNADGEEQEAVNIDWLIKTTEHFCKDKNL